MIETELAIVGGGPAGLSGAIEAARAGVEVTVIDENAKPGGQLFKQIHKFFGSKEHRAGVRGFDIGYQLLEETQKLGVEILLNTKVWGIFKDLTLSIAKDGQMDIVKAKSILLAAGAIETPLAFPGWTLPGVMGAGGAQTLVNLHRVPPGRKFLMVGSGNVGLIVAYQLLQAGAEVSAVIDIAPMIGGYSVHSRERLNPPPFRIILAGTWTTWNWSPAQRFIFPYLPPERVFPPVMPMPPRVTVRSM